MKTRFFLILTAAFLCLTTMRMSAGEPSIAMGNASYTNCLVVAIRPTKLNCVMGYNSGPQQFIQIFEASSKPTNGTIPKFSVPVGSLQYFSFDFSTYGVDMDAVTVCNSTTGDTLTLGSANCGLQAIKSK